MQLYNLMNTKLDIELLVLLEDNHIEHMHHLFDELVHFVCLHLVYYILGHILWEVVIFAVVGLFDRIEVL